jgi:polar amino acid transport system substrate-binding protein
MGSFTMFLRKLAMAAATAATLVSVAGAAAAGPVLDRIMEKREMVMATDPEYPPQSKLTSTGDFEGFDIDVGREIARRLGVQLKFVTPGWDVITAGNWQNRWDISVGSMSPTRERSKHLDFPAVYYNTPASLAVHIDNRDITSPELASGKAIGVGVATTYDNYLKRNLAIDVPGAVEFDYLIAEPRIHSYETDQLALDDLKLGDGVKLDAVITAMPTVLRSIRDGYPLKIIGGPLFLEPLAVAIDKGDREFNARLQQIIGAMHRDGTLSRLSRRWYDADLTQ